MSLSEHFAAAPAGKRALCVSIHDVAPATWSDCLRLLDAVRAVADIPLTWLVVPRFHDSAVQSGPCEAMLGSLLAQGHELALHGYTHLDPAPTGLSLRDYLLRHVYTQREGEFAAIGAAEARCRIQLGLDWFNERGWHPSGFVAPAWLLGREAWRALAGYPFAYTTTYRRFYLLSDDVVVSNRFQADPFRGDPFGGDPVGDDLVGDDPVGDDRGEGDRFKGYPVEGRVIHAPALVYAARNRAGRLLSPYAIALLARCMERAPLLRLALHPRDAQHPMLMRHMQTLLTELLHTHAPMTKDKFATSMAAALNRPAANQRIISPPAVSQPAISQPAVSQSAVSQPAISRPAISPPSARRP